MTGSNTSADLTEDSSGGAAGLLARTRFAIATAVGRRDSALVLLGVTLAYTVGYLYALRHLLPGGSGFEVRVARNPLGQLFDSAAGAFNYAPVVLVETDFFTYLFSLNTPLGVAVGALVGINVAITYLAWRQPSACGLGTASTGLLAGLPALLSGSACCGPILLILFGIQATGTLITVFEFLLPASLLLLLVSLLLVGNQVNPAAVSADR